jgi:diketogulonate reductase-like aldo/keto reductase
MNTLLDKIVKLPDGSAMPQLGIGTWRMGESSATRKEEIRAVRHAIDAGLPLIDTAEMYGDGGAEEVVGAAIRESGQSRDRLYIVSKVYPWNASKRGTVAACEASLKRLGIDALDLYLLHWRGEHPLADTVDAFERLKRDGKIRRWGVSNFDTDDMRELSTVASAGNCMVNQVYYNLAKRWPEATLLPLQRQRGIACMAYSPLNQGSLLRHRAVKAVASRLDATPAQVAIAWLLTFPDVVVIPKSSRLEGVDEIAATRSISLSAVDMAELSAAFPSPPASARMETT